MGRRRQGQDRRPVDPAFFDRGQVSGRPQRRPHRVRRGHEVHSAADSFRNSSSGRHLRHRQRRGDRSPGALCGGGRAHEGRRRCRSPYPHQRQGPPHPALPSRFGSAVGGAPRRAQTRDDLARHRAGLRGQDRAARHPRRRSRRSAWPRAGRPRQRDRPQPPRPGHRDGLAAGVRSAGGVRRAHEAVGPRRLADAQRRDAGGESDSLRRRTGNAARHRSRPTSLRRTRRSVASAPDSASGRGPSAARSASPRPIQPVSAKDRFRPSSPARWAAGCERAGTSTAP